MLILYKYMLFKVVILVIENLFFGFFCFEDLNDLFECIVFGFEEDSDLFVIVIVVMNVCKNCFLRNYVVLLLIR